MGYDIYEGEKGKIKKRYRIRSSRWRLQKNMMNY